MTARAVTIGSDVEAGLVVALLLVAANGFFVGAEFAIARLRPTQVVDFVREGRPGARSAQHAVEHIDSYLSACQLGISSPRWDLVQSVSLRSTTSWAGVR